MTVFFHVYNSSKKVIMNHLFIIIRGHGDIKCILDTLWIQRIITDI